MPGKKTAVRPQLYRIRESKIQGRGVFAARRIRRGQRIIEYTGERISNAEADRRYDEDKMRRHHTFLFVLNGRTVLDGNKGGNDSRYINHSCDPNCDAVIEGKRIFIYALKTIEPGTELAYDYQYERLPGNQAELEQLYRCECGAWNCRGTIMVPRRPRKRRRRKRR